MGDRFAIATPVQYGTPPTKAEHDAAVAAKGRPFTDEGIQNWQPSGELVSVTTLADLDRPETTEQRKGRLRLEREAAQLLGGNT